ncbi:hypothetical protein N7468_001832 [Penicillium chermesinum]|uniref:DUF218 domain-containing protein n=1 Tax=Penicillium chermesinum TaxID=63820 RepID=A0A9W9TZ07_9EURO|nr:uncharacterized protein N7468_001832 [Penicillium chermesinum]KAJ5246849.1 hypothetical protein N7468_001832 [Penicillium chermesinum]KAJ6145109.1 hypothetical protein N7470_009004 [Penicillium chermesinum]
MDDVWTPESVADINTLSEYLSDCRLRDLNLSPPVDCMIVCASEALYGAETVFQALQDRAGVAKCLVLCGGIGHSTHLLYEAVSHHPRYSRVGDAVRGLPEARVLEVILDGFFERSLIISNGCQILVEDQSTNCGQNAAYSRQVLETAGFHTPSSLVVNQDPTMMLRTRASFEKVYEDLAVPVSVVSYPAFVPKLRLPASTPPAAWNLSSWRRSRAYGLWNGSSS